MRCRPNLVRRRRNHHHKRKDDATKRNETRGEKKSGNGNNVQAREGGEFQRKKRGRDGGGELHFLWNFIIPTKIYQGSKVSKKKNILIAIKKEPNQVAGGK